MPNFTRVETKIFGSEYTITGEAEPEYIQKITEYVNDKMLELSIVYPNVNPMKLAVLASINIADELFQKKDLKLEIPKPDYNAEIVNEYEIRTKKIISLIDKGLSGDS
jgi:cell division protein ZapA